MICPRCLLRASYSRPLASIRTAGFPLQRPSQPSHRSLHSTPALLSTQDQKPIATDLAQHSTQQRHPPAATSTSSAQPFSTPHVPSPKKVGVPTSPSTKKDDATPTVISSVPAGTPLKGINYFKNKEDPVAMEDHEYPDWLWTVLDRKKAKDLLGAGETDMDPRLFAKSAKSRRAARKRARQEAMLNPESVAKKVPLYEQSVDLPAGDGSAGGAEQAADARQELTKAMRVKRRKDLKETNFLQTMG